MTSTQSKIQTSLRKASQRIHCSHELDLTARLAVSNLQYGIARFGEALDLVDPGANIEFWASQDLTITRSTRRWASGLAYGGAYKISNRNRRIIPLELRPNTCGTLLGILNEPITIERFIEKLSKCRSKYGGRSWDYGRKNHFVNLYKGAGERMHFLIHGCPVRNKSDRDGYPGLYFDSSKYWKERMVVVNTTLGDCALALDDNAEAYYQNYLRCEADSKNDRLLVTQELFDDFEVLANDTHEGMFGDNIFIQGCHIAQNTDQTFPLMTSPSEPLFVVRAREINPSPAVTLLPHGTGYKLELPISFQEVKLPGTEEHVYIFENVLNSGRQVYKDFSHIPYSFRSPDEIVRWQESTELVIVDVLTPVLAAKF